MTTAHILLVEDDAHIAEVVLYALQEHGFRCTRAPDGREGLDLFRRHTPDLVLLDLGLPGIQGLDLVREMRREQPRVPIIIVTARTEEVDRVTGLELGADDYVTKPFSPRELVARVRAVLRRDARVAGGAAPPSLLRAGPIAVSPDDLAATCAGRPLSLSRQELKLLESLMRHPARVFSRDALVDLIYAGEACVTDRSIDAQVKRIRKRVADVRPDLDPIQTVYGLGYKLNSALAAEPE